MIPERLDALRRAIGARGLDGLLVTSGLNVRWASGFTGSNGALLVLTDAVHLFTDSRYAIQAAQQSPDLELHVSNTPVAVQAGEFIAGKVLRIGFEADDLTVEGLSRLAAAASGVTFVETTSIVGEMRYIKSPEEIRAITRAAEITDEAFALIQQQIKPQVTEKQLARELEYIMLGCGADHVSFDSIVAWGPNSALAHAVPSDTELASGAMLLLDFGAMFGGYAADITRTLYLGSPDPAFRRIYSVVLEAQAKAIEAVRPGESGSEVDAVARGHIAAAGFGPNFGHSLGHSLGLDVHDGPALSVSCRLELQPGMVVTVEPGIYIEGWGGVRIEDDVLVTKDGCKLLTHSPKDLLELAF